jgi:hypothetical protein
MEKLSFRTARTLSCVGCFSFLTESDSRMTAIVPSFQAFDERAFFAASLVKVDTTSFFPALTVEVYL